MNIVCALPSGMFVATKSCKVGRNVCAFSGGFEEFTCQHDDKGLLQLRRFDVSIGKGSSPPPGPGLRDASTQSYPPPWP